MSITIHKVEKRQYVSRLSEFTSLVCNRLKGNSTVVDVACRVREGPQQSRASSAPVEELMVCVAIRSLHQQSKGHLISVNGVVVKLGGVNIPGDERRRVRDRDKVTKASLE